MPKRNIYLRLLITLRRKRFMIVVGLIAGLLGGLAAVLLKNTVWYTHYILTYWFNQSGENYLYLAYPLVGIILTIIFVRFVVKDNIGHGISRILYAMSRNKSKLASHHMYSSLIASTLTVGFGGSVGLEAPIVLTGSSIGSNIGRWLRLSPQKTKLLIACGSAGALAGIFKAPIAAVIFALEILMLDLTMASLVPLLISAVTGATVAYFLQGRSVLFNFDLTSSFSMRNIPWYVVLGVFSGFVSLYFIRASGWIESLFDKWEKPLLKAITGGLILGLLIFLFPSLYGEGYEALRSILNGKGTDILNHSFFHSISSSAWVFMCYLLLILFFKVTAMSVTLGSGGIGGVFAPSLFMGGISGYFVAITLNTLGIANVPEINFTLAGMAGIMAGVMHAPLTAIFLIAEITGGYEFFVPLIITATISYFTIIYFEPHSLYTKKLATRGELLTHHKDKSVLTQMRVNKLIETNFNSIALEANLGELVKIISISTRNIFPVVDDNGILQGIVVLDDIRKEMFQPELYESTLVKNIMRLPGEFVDANEPMEDAVNKFRTSDSYNLPVQHEGKYVGFISRANVFSSYRKIMKYTSEF
ncbi:MAG: chloride channel protein [Bacteroidota bacterium]